MNNTLKNAINIPNRKAVTIFRQLHGDLAESNMDLVTQAFLLGLAEADSDVCTAPRGSDEALWIECYDAGREIGRSLLGLNTTPMVSYNAEGAVLEVEPPTGDITYAITPEGVMEELKAPQSSGRGSTRGHAIPSTDRIDRPEENPIIEVMMMKADLEKSKQRTPDYQDMIGCAAQLLVDGGSSEYRRGILELLARAYAVEDFDTETRASFIEQDIEELLNLQS